MVHRVLMELPDSGSFGASCFLMELPDSGS